MKTDDPLCANCGMPVYFNDQQWRHRASDHVACELERGMLHDYLVAEPYEVARS